MCSFFSLSCDLIRSGMQSADVQTNSSFHSSAPLTRETLAGRCHCPPWLPTAGPQEQQRLSKQTIPSSSVLYATRCISNVGKERNICVSYEIQKDDICEIDTGKVLRCVMKQSFKLLISFLKLRPYQTSICGAPGRLFNRPSEPFPKPTVQVVFRVTAGDDDEALIKWDDLDLLSPTGKEQ